MTIRNLNHMFAPTSVAVIGASDRPHSVGATVMANLLAAGFSGPVMPVNPRHASVAGVLAYPGIADLPMAPDLAVICTPPATVPGLVAELGARGTRAAIVLTAGLGDHRQPGSLARQMLEAAKPHLLRILGPNCVGLIVPGIGLNASFAPGGAAPGNIAFVSQSGALCTAVLDWAEAQGIGFSRFVSLGDTADVDFGDVIDDLASDPQTKAILLYIESVGAMRKFLSAARAAARNKPIVAVKAGRVAEAAKAAHSHTGALAGADAAFDAALARAGVVRVRDIDALFDVVETLARVKRVEGDRLLIVTNGGGVGVMAVDALIEAGGQLAELSEDGLAKLDDVLPATWSRGNPIDIIGDAPPERYRAALEIALEEKGADAVLVLNAPTAIAESAEAASAVADLCAGSARPVFTCWLGRKRAAASRRILSAAGLATYDSPEGAVLGFLNAARYLRLQRLLLEVPPAVPEETPPDLAAARAVIAVARGEGRTMLTEPEAKHLLAAFGVPVVPTAVAATPEEAGACAREIGFPVALKILSPEISHKSDVGGVVLQLHDDEAVRDAAETMIARVHELRPDARIQGFTVSRMVHRAGAYEMIVGLGSDPVVGPFVLVGEGGKAVELLADRAVGLPPLNMKLAADLVDSTRVSRRLKGYRDEAAVDLPALYGALVAVAQIAVDLPEVAELDINPLLIDADGVIALDARVVLGTGGKARLAIRPYPRELEETIALEGIGTVLLRPIRPEDEPSHYEFLSRLTSEDIRMRFFGQVKSLPHSQMARMTQIDYDREMAFIAVGEDGKTLGVVRSVTDPDNEVAQFAIVVRSDLHGRGLGVALMHKLIAYSRGRGTGRIEGEVLRDNQRMREFVRELGFVAKPYEDQDAVRVELTL